MRIIPLIIILITGFFFSCGDEEQEILGPFGPLTNPEQAFFYIKMEEEENHQISVNFFNLQSVSKISFIIGFDSEVFTVNNSGIEFNQEYSLADEIGPNIESSTVGFWYDFIGAISGEGKLLTLDLEPVPGGSLQGTDIDFIFNEIIFLDEDLNYLYYNCSIPSYLEPEVCRDNGGFWGPNPDEISITSICYIDEGIINQFFENSSEPLENWEPTGNYVWSSILCGYE